MVKYTQTIHRLLAGMGQIIIFKNGVYFDTTTLHKLLGQLSNVILITVSLLVRLQELWKTF